jgi:hypothetical protein
MLDRRDLSPVGYRRYNKTTGKEVAWEDIVSGFEYDDGQYVVLTEEELREAEIVAEPHVRDDEPLEARVGELARDEARGLLSNLRGDTRRPLLRGHAARCTRAGAGCGSVCPGPKRLHG